MDKKRVLLVAVPSLLGEGLERILSKLEDVELIGPLDPGSPVLSRLSKAAPDVVLVARDAGKRRTIVSMIARIVERYPDLPVVCICLEHNTLRVYSSRTLAARSADLIETVRGLAVLPSAGGET